MMTHDSDGSYTRRFGIVYQLPIDESLFSKLEPLLKEENEFALRAMNEVLKKANFTKRRLKIKVVYSIEEAD